MKCTPRLLPLRAALIAALASAGVVQIASAGELNVNVSSLLSDVGHARIILVGSKDQYEGRTNPEHIASVVIHDGLAKWQVGNLAPGRYALIVHHDANANNELDRPIFGLPFEPYGFSNDAWKTFGVPGWDETNFEINSRPVDQNITVRLNPVAGALIALKAGAPSMLLIALGLAVIAMARRCRRNRSNQTQPTNH